MLVIFQGKGGRDTTALKGQFFAKYLVVGVLNVFKNKRGSLGQGIAHNIKQFNDIRSTAQVLQNFDFAFDLLLLDGLQNLSNTNQRTNSFECSAVPSANGHHSSESKLFFLFREIEFNSKEIKRPTHLDDARLVFYNVESLEHLTVFTATKLTNDFVVVLRPVRYGVSSFEEFQGDSENG